MSVSVFDQGPDPAQRDIHLQEKFPAENLRLIIELVSLKTQRVS